MVFIAAVSVTAERSKILSKLPLFIRVRLAAKAPFICVTSLQPSASLSLRLSLRIYQRNPHKTDFNENSHWGPYGRMLRNSKLS
jgi:hypothetical protein